MAGHDLATGRYSAHEVQAVDGYQLAADQTVSVVSLKVPDVKVADTKIPERLAPPTFVTISELPKSGARSQT
ncbi:hypothetical protein GCM10020000_86490 [Streptomyces olivoverticillatus]